MPEGRGGRNPRAAALLGGLFLVPLAALMVVVFVIVAAALGDEIYRCDVLRIPNCD